MHESLFKQSQKAREILLSFESVGSTYSIGAIIQHYINPYTYELVKDSETPRTF